MINHRSGVSIGLLHVWWQADQSKVHVSWILLEHVCAVQPELLLSSMMHLCFRSVIGQHTHACVQCIHLWVSMVMWLAGSKLLHCHVDELSSKNFAVAITASNGPVWSVRQWFHDLC